MFFEVVTSVTHFNECFVSSGLKMLFRDNARLLAVASSEREDWQAECCLRLCRSPSRLWCGQVYGSSKEPEWIANRLQVNFQECFLGLDALHSLFQTKLKLGISFSCVSSSVAARVDACLPRPHSSRDAGGTMEVQ